MIARRLFFLLALFSSLVACPLVQAEVVRLAKGVNTSRGKVTCCGVAEGLGYECACVADIL